MSIGAQARRAWSLGRARLTHRFFHHFFSLLIGVVSLAQWILVCWFARDQVAAFGWTGLLIGPVLVYLGNQLVLRCGDALRRSSRGGALLLRVYSSAALTALFCALYLFALNILWLPATVLLEAFAVAARASDATSGVPIGGDPRFTWLANTGIALVVLAFAYGYSFGQRRVRITRLTLDLAHVPPALAGLRIVHISDLHIGDNLPCRQLAAFVSRVNALEPDVICITGDIVDSPRAEMSEGLTVLDRLRAPGGVFAILGNHDHYAGAERVHAALLRWTSITVLRDAATTLRWNGSPLHLIGLDDRGLDWARGVPSVPILDELRAQLPPNEPVLLLCHRPDAFAHAAAVGIDLTLSGHTHGGQIGIPWFGGRVRNLAEFFTRFDRGLFEENGHYLYVNCGLGITGLRIRLATPREITVIEARNRPTHARAA
jgi:hypothetical protein